MKLFNLPFATLLVILVSMSSCKKNQPSYKIEGTYTGNFQGIYNGNDTIVNEGYLVFIEALDKSTATVEATMVSKFEVLVTPNGLNIELVSPTDGLTEFLYQGETEKLTFSYQNGDNVANYVGYKQ